MCLGTELFITVDLLGLFLFTDEQHIRQSEGGYFTFSDINGLLSFVYCSTVLLSYTVDMLGSSVYC